MKNKIRYSKKDLLSKNEFSGQNAKIRITTFLDIDVIEALKKEAKKSGLKYQTLLNKKLRHELFDEEIIEDRLHKLEKRLLKIEKKVS